MAHADSPLRRLIVAVDMRRYSAMDPLGQLDAQQAMTGVLDEAAANARLDRSRWERQPQGDAELAILPPDTDEAVVVADFSRELATSLRRANRALNPGARLRLRLAVHCGVLHRGPLGYPGAAPVETCRLLDAPGLKDALAASDEADLALIVSARLFHDIVEPGYRGLRPELFRRVDVTVKEYRGTGYLTLPGAAMPPGERDEPAPAGMPGNWPAVRAVSLGSGDAVGRDKIEHHYR